MKDDLEVMVDDPAMMEDNLEVMEDNLEVMQMTSGWQEWPLGVRSLTNGPLTDLQWWKVT